MPFSFFSFADIGILPTLFKLILIAVVCHWHIFSPYSDFESHTSSFFFHANKLLFWCWFCLLQESPSNLENLSFVILGNKVDVDGGNNRVVNISTSPHNVDN
jgi:hypothetical protein